MFSFFVVPRVYISVKNNVGMHTMNVEVELFRGTRVTNRKGKSMSMTGNMVNVEM